MAKITHGSDETVKRVGKTEPLEEKEAPAAPEHRAKAPSASRLGQTAVQPARQPLGGPVAPRIVGSKGVVRRVDPTKPNIPVDRARDAEDPDGGPPPPPPKGDPGPPEP